MMLQTLLTLVLCIFGATESETITARQINVDGFGDRTNQYAWSMITFNNSLYIGTLNVKNGVIGIEAFSVGKLFETNGAQIYKGNVLNNGTYSWQCVLSKGNGNHWNFGVRNLKVVNNYLYGVTGNYMTGFELWQTNDGINWKIIISNGFDNRDNDSGRGLIAYKNYLYIGVNNGQTGGKIYRRQLQTDGDFVMGSEWEIITNNGFDDPSNIWFSGFAEYIGYLYVGTFNRDGMQLFRSINGTYFENIFINGNGDKNDWNAMKLYVFQSRLYIGTMNIVNGASLWRNVDDDGKVFETVFTSGNTDRYNSYVWQMVEYNDRLYVGTLNIDNNLEFILYSSSNPGYDPWVIETGDAFGNPYQYGLRTMDVYENKLIIGTATNQYNDSCQVYEATSITLR